MQSTRELLSGCFDFAGSDEKRLRSQVTISHVCSSVESTRAITAAGKTGLHGGSSIRARSLRVDFVRFFALSVEALLEFFAGTEGCPLAGGDLKGLARCGIASGSGLRLFRFKNAEPS